MSENSWEKYVERTRDKKPRPLLVRAVALVADKNEALDLGSGALNDVRYLVTSNFRHVTAVDSKPVADEIIKFFPKETVSYLINTFEEFKFSENYYDLVNAQYALPFNPSESFDRVIRSIVKSLKSGGVFTGQFFGDRDEWNTPQSKMTFHSREQAEKLLSDLKIVEFTEEDQLGKTAAGNMKRWHVFHFIAVK
jgi:SAM-dependent methyltransferase